MKIIALHGAGMTGETFSLLRPLLKNPLHAETLPGHGDGAQPLASIAEMAAHAARHLSEPCILAGHSMGALVALEAANHPAVAGLVLMGAAAKMPVHPDLLKQAQDAPATAAGLVLKWGTYTPTADKDLLRRIMAEGESALHNDLAACDSYKNGETAAKALQKPVLVVSGSHDKMVKPEFSAAFAQMFPAGRLLRLEETGHMMPVENPSATATALDGFIAGITKI